MTKNIYQELHSRKIKYVGLNFFLIFYVLVSIISIFSNSAFISARSKNGKI